MSERLSLIDACFELSTILRLMSGVSVLMAKNPSLDIGPESRPHIHE
jgi:hypothetical protein